MSTHTGNCPWLQITVGHRTMADQNLPMSDEIPTLVGHNGWTIFVCLPTQMLTRYNGFCFKRKLQFTLQWQRVRLAGSLIKQYCMMADLIFVLSDQNGDSVGHMSFQENKIICSPGIALFDLKQRQVTPDGRRLTLGASWTPLTDSFHLLLKV